MRTLFSLTLSWILLLPLLSAEVQQVHVDPRPVRLPIISGRDIRFNHLSTTEGLSQIKVSQILQDDQGFMWFGTQYGLNRFDGYKFKVFVNDPRDPNSLSGVLIGALFKDRDGTLWVGCDQFINRFDRETETFRRYPVPSVFHISQDATGILWLATPTGLYALDPATGQIRRYSHDPNDLSSLSSNDIKSSGEDREGRFWVASDKGLEEFDRTTGKVMLRIPARGLGFSFYEDRFGALWIFANMTAVFDRKTNTLTQYSFYERKSPSTVITGVNAILEDRNGTLWLATNGAGLLKFDREHRRFISYRNNPLDPESIGQDNVISLFGDREGNVWAGLGGMGLSRFSTTAPPFKRYRHDFGNPNSTGEPFVGAIYEDRLGILWIGNHEALNRIDRTTGQYSSYPTAGPGEGSDVITIREDRSGGLWVGTFSHGLYRFDRRTRQFTRFQHNPADPYSLSNDIVSRLLIDHNGTLWAATWDGLNRFDAATERFRTYRPDSQDRTPFYLELGEDSKGALWLGTHASGLQRFEPETGQFAVYQHDIHRPGALSDNRVNSVYFDRSGTTWVGTQNGLNKLEPKTGTFTVYTQQDGLAGNAVGCILEDGHGDLWMSTNNGVSRFDTQRKAFKNYSTADGLPGADFTGWGACFKSASGEMFFAGFSGATAFYPDKVEDSSYVPPVVLTNFRLSGGPVAIGGGSPLEKSITYASVLNLSHRQNMFSLEFSALSYSNPATNRYRYKLEGLDSEWHEVGSEQRLVNYTTLPAGIYRFRVQGATSRGPWSDGSAGLRIEILPPWWSTLWFRVLCGAAFLALFWTLYQLRLRRLAWEFNMTLETRVNERTRIARDLHDTLLQSFHGLMFEFQAARNMLPRRPKEAMEVLDSAIVGTEQAIAQSRDAIQDIRSEPVAQSDLAQLLTAAGQELANSQEDNREAPVFRVIVEGERQTLSPILQDEVYRIAREVLRNAFQHARAHLIEAEIRYDDHLLCLRIRDDGQGIDPKVQKEGRRAGHWGLPGIRERAQRIGAQLDFWSEAGAGTEVQLTVPAAVAYETSPDSSMFRLFQKAGSHEHRS
ncbi:MAG: Two component sensor histidine kinase [Edaphobacter sp.]|nr:Two component sensor histidine kinase [Edaphobacter sp.]